MKKLTLTFDNGPKIGATDRILDIGSNTALGNSSLFAISGGFLRAVDAVGNPAARTIPASVPAAWNDLRGLAYPRRTRCAEITAAAWARNK